MKIIALFIIALAAGYFFFTNTNEPSITPSPIPYINNETKLEDFIEYSSITDSEKEYSVYWLKPTKPSNLSLIPNFDKKENSKKIFQNESCSFLINAGFYTKEGQPAGFFRSSEKILRKWQKNNLFNGVLFESEDEYDIVNKDPEDNLEWGVQTGPILIEKGEERALKISNDKYARRSVAIITKDNNLSFLVIFEKNSVFSGPILADLPKLLTRVAKDHDLDIYHAINLDGGTASAFMTNSLSITEAMPVGAFFCLML